MTDARAERPDECRKRLRGDMRKKRAALDGSTRAAFDDTIRQHVARLVGDLNCRKIAAYWPFNGEPDLTPLFEPLVASGCQLALPVVDVGDGHRMRFHAWQAGVQLIPNRYGIPEPSTAPQVELDDYDLLLMPLVAYDTHGNRLGMGAGYYDRHLETLRDAPRPLRAGVAYSLQETGPLGGNHWDIPLHGVVNERGWFTFA